MLGVKYCFFFLVAFESLSDLIKGKLKESLDQSTFEQHLKVLEALVKHWKGEVLSVSVTRTAEGCKIFLSYFSVMFETT